ncbi:MAG: excinuclease ABC subunit UvrC [Desulfobulbaceae bacterium]|uniref:UvrABC system protein C n=1 Tax=Candidatus Desulfatifera sulfidica TaxID=2841691 RepID=A0A8J6NCY9_9BACT|nr:excinuclease ABC subunit UvrC [Candidatus Desulfatifera sulfidica]
MTHSPGVYLMLDSKGTVVYVGKAKDLRKRLTSYTRQQAAEHNKTAVMLSRVKALETIITRTEKEALILEASLIKQHRPRYNIILRDDKNYPLIKVTVHEQWPRLLMTRRRHKDGARYFGPYASSSAMWETLKLLWSLFPLRRCKDRQLRPRKRACLNQQLRHCLAPCTKDVDSGQYKEMVAQILMVLEGRSQELIRDLRNQMEQAADVLNFELAASIRDQITALEKTLEQQVVETGPNQDSDCFGLSRKESSVALTVLQIRNGRICGSRSFFFAAPIEDNPAILTQVLHQYYDTGADIPATILLPCSLEDQGPMADYLSDLRNGRVNVLVPQRGVNRRLMDMACKNSAQVLEERARQEQSWQALSKLMVKQLHLTRAPENIECLDISNTSGKQAVGSLVSFHQGVAAKKQYRCYRIKSIDTPDDYAMMSEVLTRRFVRGIEEDNLPDLFLVDGGRGQLNIAQRVAKETGIFDRLEWLGIAKERADEGEKIYKPGQKNSINLPAHNPVLLKLMQIRDESHRYGITMHRKLRNKAAFSSELDQIPGIGSEKKKRLLQEMGSLKRIKAAGMEELQKVPGIGPELARAIYHKFHPEK